MFYAIRKICVDYKTYGNQLLKFKTKADRSAFCRDEIATPITAVEARELFVTSTWRGYRTESGMIFFGANYFE